MEETRKQEYCFTCGYYHQHYGWNGRFYAIFLGHCNPKNRARHCRPDKKACEDWKPQTEEYRETYFAPSVRHWPGPKNRK